MTTLNAIIECAVKEAIEAREPAANITAPLLNMLARVLVGTAAASGSSVDELLDIACVELTEAVAHYTTQGSIQDVAHNPDPDRRP